MLNFSQAVQLWYCPDPVDMRLGFDDVPDHRHPGGHEQVMGSVIAITFVAEEDLLASLSDDAERRLADAVEWSGRRR